MSGTRLGDERSGEGQGADGEESFPERAWPDSHCHLSIVSRSAGEERLRSWLDSADSTPLLDPGVDPGDLAARLDAWGGRPRVLFSAGAWPSEASCTDPSRALALLAADLFTGACRAIGECGLDYHWMSGSRETQLRLFEGQIELAERRGLPVIVHSRDAFDDTLAVVRAASGRIRFVLHCFSYGPAQAEAMLALGATLSFSGTVTYRSARETREALRIVPEDRLLLETDAPYLAPEPNRGRPCLPWYVEATYRACASARGVAPERLAACVAANMDALFGR